MWGNIVATFQLKFIFYESFIGFLLFYETKTDYMLKFPATFQVPAELKPETLPNG